MKRLLGSVFPFFFNAKEGKKRVGGRSSCSLENGLRMKKLLLVLEVNTEDLHTKAREEKLKFEDKSWFLVLVVFPLSRSKWWLCCSMLYDLG